MTLITQLSALALINENRQVLPKPMFCEDGRIVIFGHSGALVSFADGSFLVEDLPNPSGRSVPLESWIDADGWNDGHLRCSTRELW